MPGSSPPLATNGDVGLTPVATKNNFFDFQRMRRKSSANKLLMIIEELFRMSSSTTFDLYRGRTNDQRTRKDVRPKLRPGNVHGQDLCEIERERDGVLMAGTWAVSRDNRHLYKDEPRWNPISSDPRFADLLRRGIAYPHGNFRLVSALWNRTLSDCDSNNETLPKM